MSSIRITPIHDPAVSKTDGLSRRMALVIGRPKTGAIILSSAAIGLVYALSCFGLTTPVSELVLAVAVACATLLGGRATGLAAAALAGAYLIAVRVYAAPTWGHAMDIPWIAMGFAVAAPLGGWVAGVAALRGRQVAALKTANRALEQQLAEMLRSEESNRRCVDVLSKSPGYLSFVDRNYRYQVVNDAYLKLFDRPRDEIVGRTLEELWGAEQFANSLKPFIDKALAGHTIEFENSLRLPGAADRCFHISVTPLREGRGSVSGIAVCGRDITERKRVEEMLQEVSMAQAHAMPGISRLNPEGRYEQVNEAYAAMLGSKPEDLVGRSFEPTIFADDLPIALAAYERMKKEGKAEFEVRGVREDGSLFFKHLLMVRRTDPDGTFLGHHCFMRDITERKQIAIERNAAVSELLASECRLQQAVDALDGAVWDWNIRTGDTYRSSNWLQMLGFAPGELAETRKAWWNLVHREDRSRVLQELRAHFAGRRPAFSYECRLQTKSGGWLWMAIRGRVVERAADGSPLRAVGANINITERKLAEEAQVALSTRNEALVQALGEIAYEVWPAQDRVRWDGDYTRILGYTPEEIGNDRASWQERVHPDDLERVVLEMRDAQNRGLLINSEYRFRHKDGTYRWMLDRGRIFLNERGERVRIVGVFKDISERRRREEELRASEQRLHLALDSLDGGVWYWNVRTGEIDRSLGWWRMTGYEPGDVPDTVDGFLSLVYPEDTEDVQRHMRLLLDGRSEALTYEFRLRSRSGTWLWISTQGRVMEQASDGTPLHIAGVSINVTERRLAEERLMRKARQEEFIGGLSRMVVGNRELDEILQTVVRGSTEIVEVEIAGILEVLPPGDRLLLRAGVGWENGLVGRRTVPDEQSSLAIYTLQSKESILIEDLATETRFQPPKLLRDHGVVSGVSVIIGDISRPYGVLGVHTRSRRKFDQGDLHFIENVAGVIAEAVYYRQTEHLVRQSRERLRKLAARMNRIREEERRMIAREIHDELGQNLTGLRIDLAWMLERLPRRKPELAERARSALVLADQTLDTVRKISHDLRPAMLDDLGLEAAMEWQIGEFSRRTDCRCKVDLQAGPIGMDNERDTAVFRILQEALTNIARHAAADEVKVSLRAPDGRLVLEIADNGCGISDEAIRSNESIGLIGMRERVGALGGRMKFTRGQKHGTLVHMEMPLDRH